MIQKMMTASMFYVYVEICQLAVLVALIAKSDCSKMMNAIVFQGGTTVGGDNNFISTAYHTTTTLHIQILINKTTTKAKYKNIEGCTPEDLLLAVVFE